MSEIRLEAVGTADRAPWAALWRDYLTFYGTAMRDDVYNAAFAQIMSDDPASFQARLAWRDETAIGLVQWVWHPHLWHPSQGVVYMQDLYVAPSARGAGIGGRLIRAVFADADARGAADVYWLTQYGNPARLLYDGMGERTDFVKYKRRA